MQEWEKVVYGFLVAVAAIYLPNGVLGLIKDLVHRLRTRQERARMAVLQEKG